MKSVLTLMATAFSLFSARPALAHPTGSDSCWMITPGTVLTFKKDFNVKPTLSEIAIDGMPISGPETESLLFTKELIRESAQKGSFRVIPAAYDRIVPAGKRYVVDSIEYRAVGYPQTPVDQLSPISQFFLSHSGSEKLYFMALNLIPEDGHGLKLQTGCGAIQTIEQFETHFQNRLKVQFRAPTVD